MGKATYARWRVGQPDDNVNADKNLSDDERGEVPRFGVLVTDTQAGRARAFRCALAGWAVFGVVDGLISLVRRHLLPAVACQLNNVLLACGICVFEVRDSQVIAKVLDCAAENMFPISANCLAALSRGQPASFGRVGLRRHRSAISGCECQVELLLSDGFGDVVVHAGVETTLAIAFHRVRRQADYVQPMVGSLFPKSQLAGCFEAVFGPHLQIHKDSVKDDFSR